MLIALSAIGTYIFLHIKAGGAIMAVYFTLCFALLALLWFLLIHFGIRIFSHFLNSYSYKEWLKNTINLLWSGLCLAILLWFSLDFPVPVPNWFPKEGNVASSMRATAEKLF